jgi:hypothetical protein
MDAHTNYFQDKSSLSGIGALDREIVKYIRNQRHDFMNEIQIIWGYLQLEKSEEAKKYIAQLISKLEVHRRVLNLGDSVLSLFLYDHIVHLLLPSVYINRLLNTMHLFFLSAPLYMADDDLVFFYSPSWAYT